MSRYTKEHYKGVTMPERRALTDDEKRAILSRDGMRCLIDGHPIDDVAKILKDAGEESAHAGPAYRSMDWQTVENLAHDFADLFVTDNPKCCIHCGDTKGTTEVCASADGRLRDEHTFEYGFDPEQFLTACGLEGEAPEPCEECGGSGSFWQKEEGGSLSGRRTLCPRCQGTRVQA